MSSDGSVRGAWRFELVEKSSDVGCPAPAILGRRIRREDQVEYESQHCGSINVYSDRSVVEIVQATLVRAKHSGQVVRLIEFHHSGKRPRQRFRYGSRLPIRPMAQLFETR